MLYFRIDCLHVARSLSLFQSKLLCLLVHASQSTMLWVAPISTSVHQCISHHLVQFDVHKHQHIVMCLRLLRGLRLLPCLTSKCIHQLHHPFALSLWWFFAQFRHTGARKVTSHLDSSKVYTKLVLINVQFARFWQQFYFIKHSSILG